MASCVEFAKESAEWIARNSQHVRISNEGIGKMAQKLASDLDGGIVMPEWDFDHVHFNDGTPLTAQYILVLDTLNFCFWPDPSLHYSHLASGLCDSLLEDPTCLDANKLATVTGTDVRKLLGRSNPLPLEDERARLLNQLGLTLSRKFGGTAANLILSAEGSASALVDVVTSNIIGFQDHCVFKGRQVGFYKRAQIFAADIWGAFKGQGLGAFSDIGDLTMFADYLVPCVLLEAGVLSYSPELEHRLRERVELAPGSDLEVELRGCSIAAVQRLRDQLLSASIPREVTSVHLDWWLWSLGINNSTPTIPHHRTLTIYY